MDIVLTDVHTHSMFSADGRSPLEDMLATACAMGAAYYGVSEHFDYDYKVNAIPFFGGAEAAYTRPDAYFSRAKELRKEYEGRMTVLVGGEFGFAENPAAASLYREIVEKYRPDFVVNSVHTQGKADFAMAGAFFPAATNGAVRVKDFLAGEEGKASLPLDKGEVYRQYFGLVKKSLDAEYDYDIVGHPTYCARYAPYAEKRATVREFGKEIDGILKGIIERGKILEVNTSNRGLADDFLPSAEILKRYFSLGGRKVSFGSDAHDKSRIMEKRDVVVGALKEIGFGYITVPRLGEHIRVAI